MSRPAETHLTGLAVVRLMRQHKQTIRGLAETHKITMKRVREVRTRGVSGFAADEWVYLITGCWPDQPAQQQRPGEPQ